MHLVGDRAIPTHEMMMSQSALVNLESPLKVVNMNNALQDFHDHGSKSHRSGAADALKKATASYISQSSIPNMGSSVTSLNSLRSSEFLTSNNHLPPPTSSAHHLLNARTSFTLPFANGDN